MSLILSGTDGLSDVDGSAATPAIRGTDANTGIFFPSADTIGFSEGGAEVARFDSSGNLGLGATPSAWSGFRALDVGSRSALVDLTSAQQTDIWSNAYFNGTNSIYKTTANASIYRQTTGQHIWFNAPSGTAGNAITFTQAMTLDASGNLGIGITSPNSYANYKTLSIFGTNGGELDMGDGTTTRLNLYSSSTSVQLSAVGAIPLVFNTNSAERARIDSSGNLLVGKTTTSATTQGGYISSAGQYVVAQPASTGAVFFQNTSGGATVGTITINASTTTYGTSSDYRLKENIVPMVGALSAVSALKPVTYNWKIDGSDGQGFIAHELAEVCPEAVQGKKDAVDDEGNPVYQGIDTSFLVATLTAAIQEQQALITQLTARITALESA